MKNLLELKNELPTLNVENARHIKGGSECGGSENSDEKRRQRPGGGVTTQKLPSEKLTKQTW